MPGVPLRARTRGTARAAGPPRAGSRGHAPRGPRRAGRRDRRRPRSWHARLRDPLLGRASFRRGAWRDAIVKSSSAPSPASLEQDAHRGGRLLRLPLCRGQRGASVARGPRVEPSRRARRTPRPHRGRLSGHLTGLAERSPDRGDPVRERGQASRPSSPRRRARSRAALASAAAVLVRSMTADASASSRVRSSSSARGSPSPSRSTSSLWAAASAASAAAHGLVGPFEAARRVPAARSRADPSRSSAAVAAAAADRWASPCRRLVATCAFERPLGACDRRGSSGLRDRRHRLFADGHGSPGTSSVRRVRAMSA